MFYTGNNWSLGSKACNSECFNLQALWTMRARNGSHRPEKIFPFLISKAAHLSQQCRKANLFKEQNQRSCVNQLAGAFAHSWFHISFLHQKIAKSNSLMRDVVHCKYTLITFIHCLMEPDWAERWKKDKDEYKFMLSFLSHAPLELGMCFSVAASCKISPSDLSIGSHSLQQPF